MTLAATQAKHFGPYALLALLLGGCVTFASASRVRIVTGAEAVTGCQSLGSVSDDDMTDLQRKAVRLGGDVALVTLQTRGAWGRTYTTADVYRCGGSGR